MSGGKVLAAVLLCVSITGATLLYAAETPALTQALNAIRTATTEAVTQTDALRTEIARVRTLDDALGIVNRFYAIVSRLNDEINAVEKEFSGRVETRRLSTGMEEFKRRAETSGNSFGASLGTLPPDILEASEFVAALQKIKNLVD